VDTIQLNQRLRRPPARIDDESDKGEEAGAHGLGRLEDGGHPHGLLEQQVRRMHPGSLSPRFGSDREEGFAVLFVFFSSKEKRRSWEMGNEWQVVGEVTERKNRLCLIGRATCACCVSPLSQHCYTPSFRSTKVRNGGSLPPVGFDGGNSRPPVSARLPQGVGLGKMVRRMDEKKLLLLQLSSKAEKKIPLAPSMFHGQSGPRSDFFFFGSCCLLSHGRPWLGLPLRVAFPFLSFFHNVVRNFASVQNRRQRGGPFAFINARNFLRSRYGTIEGSIHYST
jgi:hypothetical protein